MIRFLHLCETSYLYKIATDPCISTIQTLEYRMNFTKSESLLRSLFIVLFLLIIAPVDLLGQQIQTYVDRDSVQIGDIINYSIVIDGPMNLTNYPAEADFTEDFEMITRQRFQVTAQRDSIVYRLQFFGVDDALIPPKEFHLSSADRDTTILSNRVPLSFKTSLSETDEEFRPFKPIYDFTTSYWVYLILLLLLLIATWLIWRYMRSKTKDEPVEVPPFRFEPFVNPLDDLVKSVNDLKTQLPLHSDEEFEQFYIELGDSIRKYLKRVHKFQALEMTTGEIIRELQKLNLSYDLIKSTRKVLNEADIVKFANFKPDNEQLREALDAAFSFIETVKEVDHERINYIEYQHNEMQYELKEEYELKYGLKKSKKETEE